VTSIPNLADDTTRDIRDLIDGVSYEPEDVVTVRHVKVYDAADMQCPHRTARDIIRPRRVEIHLLNGVVTHVCVYGLAVLRGGKTGKKEGLRFFGRKPDASNPEPKWLTALVAGLGLYWPGRTDRASR
jgi:hypothetical protein